MSGLLLIAIAVAWLAAVVAISGWVARRFTPMGLKVASGLAVFSVLLTAPVADELIGRRQFEALCADDGRPRSADLERARGQALLVSLGRFQPVADTILETQAALYTYSDMQSGEPVIRFHTYRTKGGWLIRALALSERNAPLTFSAECRAPNGETLQVTLDRYQIKPVFNR